MWAHQITRKPRKCAAFSCLKENSRISPTPEAEVITFQKQLQTAKLRPFVLNRERVMKRDIFAELLEGLEALANERRMQNQSAFRLFRIYTGASVAVLTGDSPIGDKR